LFLSTDIPQTGSIAVLAISVLLSLIADLPRHVT